MSGWPSTTIAGPALATISSLGPDSLGDVNAVCGQVGASAVWPAANRAMYIPFTVERTCTALQMAVNNGATAAGTTYVGLYDDNFARLVTANAAQTGTSVHQKFDITDTLLTPGLYYMALLNTLGTSTFLRSGPNLELLTLEGMRQESTGGTLPTTATPVAMGNSYVPLLAILLAATF